MASDDSDLLATSYAFGAFVLDADLRELRGPDGRVEVQRKVLQLLFFLARNADRVVAKEELLEAVWPGTVVSDSVLSQAVRKARGALGEDGAAQQLIRTVHGHGYRLEAEVRPLAPGAPAAVLPLASPAAERPAVLTPAFDLLDRTEVPPADAPPPDFAPLERGEAPAAEAAAPDFGPLDRRDPPSARAALPDFGPLPGARPAPPRVARWRWAVAGGVLVVIALFGMAVSGA